MKIKKISQEKQSTQHKQLLEKLSEKNPEINLAHKIMEQTKKTQKSAVTVDQNNYYKFP